MNHFSVNKTKVTDLHIIISSYFKKNISGAKKTKKNHHNAELFSR